MGLRLQLGMARERSEKKSKKEHKSSKEEKRSKKRSSFKADQPSPKKQKPNVNEKKASVSSQEIKSYREKNMITLEMGKGYEDIAPFLSFTDASTAYPDLQPLLDAFCGGFDAPTPIQSQCWPVALSGRDLIGIAETGSGKTLGFLLPGIFKMNNEASHTKKKRSKQPSILVLTPTRELAMQSDEVCNAASQLTSVQSICVAGGLDRASQTNSIKKGAQVVFATPGRLISLINSKEIDLSKVCYLVLDEADRMLDMGFEPDIKAIMKELPSTRQTMMFSATWPEDIQALAANYLTKPARVNIGTENLSACSRVTQIVELIDGRKKDQRLEQLLRKYHDGKNRVLIFCLYKKEAARVERTVQRNGWNVKGIHGDMSQHQRTQAFHSFRDGSVPLLVATDVASRGLDIPNVEYVINYTFPLTIEDYIHRIGRTGRANKTGIAHTFFTINEKTKAGDLCKILKEAGQKVPKELEKFGPTIKKKKSHALYGTAYNANDGEEITKAPTKITFDSDSE